MADALRSILPPPLQAKLAQLQDRLSEQDLNDILSDLAALPANKIAQVAKELSAASHINWPRPRGGYSLISFHEKPASEFDLLQANPNYAWLFLFHHSGYVREAALKAIRQPPASLFFFTALAWRLNDWVGAVRLAASDCAERVLIETSTDVAAASALDLLDRRFSWGRWSGEDRILDSVFGRPDIIAGLADNFRIGTTGGLATCLRNALRYPHIDGHLPRLAAEAVQPAVRATAYRCLLAGKAQWTDGFSWMWIDKVYGLRKRVPTYSSRELSSSKPIDVLIREGIRDRSPVVRRIAADALMEIRAQVPDGKALIALLATDRSPSVRARADFMIRHNYAA